MEKEVTQTTGSDHVFSSNTEYNRYGLISAILLIVGCTGGLAVGMGAVERIITLTLVVVPTMTTLSLLLAVAPMKWILKAGIAATVINSLFILYFAIV